MKKNRKCPPLYKGRPIHEGVSPKPPNINLLQIIDKVEEKNEYIPIIIELMRMVRDVDDQHKKEEISRKRNWTLILVAVITAAGAIIAAIFTR